jgi:hypothetical protein
LNKTARLNRLCDYEFGEIRLLAACLRSHQSARCHVPNVYLSAAFVTVLPVLSECRINNFRTPDMGCRQPVRFLLQDTGGATA